MTYSKIIENFKDPDDGVERTFSFTGNTDPTGLFVDFEATVTRIGTVSEEGQAEVRKVFKEYNLFNVLASPIEDSREDSPWTPAQQLARVSEVMSSSPAGQQKYGVDFARDFLNDIYVLSNFKSVGDKTVITDNFGGNPEDAYEKFTFRFPIAIPLEVNTPGSVRWTGNMGDMKDFLQSPVVSDQLEKAFQKIENLDTATNRVYGDPDSSAGWKVYLPSIFLEISDKEGFAKSVQEQLQVAIDEGSGTGLTKEQRESKLPLNEQAILLYRLGELLPLNREKRNKEEYDRFATLECRGSQEIEVLVNYVTAPPDASSLFDRIRPIHLSAIVPRVRIWKEYTWDSKRAKDSGAKSEEPIFIEYEFEEHINPGLLGQTLTTNTGVGLESFNWEFNGDNSFSAEKLIQAQLKLRAQSIDALEEKRVSSNSSSSKVNNYAFSDIFIPEKRRKDNSGKRGSSGDFEEFEYKNMRLRAEIEYAVDKNSPVFREDRQVANTLDGLKLVLNLGINKYSIDLKDDGSVGVTIDFVGSIDNTTEDPSSGDILPDQDFTEDQRANLIEERNMAFLRVDSEQALINDLKAEREKQLDPTRQSTLTDEQKAQEEESYKKAVKESKKEIRRLTSEYSLSSGTGEEPTETYLGAKAKKEFDRLRLYRTILMGLLKRKVIHTAVIDPSDVAKTFQDIAKGSNKLELILNENMSLQEQNFTAQIAAEGKDVSLEEVSSLLDRLDERLYKDIFPMYTDELYQIKFFYFGDLMDIVLDNMYSGKGKPSDLDIRTVLGPIEINRNVFSSDQLPGGIKFLSTGKIVVADRYGTYDPAKTRDLKNAVKQAEDRLGGGTSTTAAPQTETILASLADIPISLNLFLKWFAEKVSNKNLFGYSFKRFLVDAAQSLIVSALQADSSRILLPKQKRKIVTVMWDGATTSEPDAFGFVKDPQTGVKIALSKKERIDRSRKGSQLEQVRSDIQSSYRLGGGSPMSDYLLVYASSSTPKRKYSGTQKEYLRDVFDGVYHLTLGRDVGVVKDISLSAPATPGYEEMQLQKARKTGSIVTKRIYSATITMYGVTFFRPGQMIYIEPAAYGTRENLKAHGLCGYYTIITTSNNFAAGKFETTLECAFWSEG